MFEAISVIEKKAEALVKDVDYLGLKLTVPCWVDYITTDNDGTVFVWGQHAPVYEEDGIWVVKTANSPTRYLSFAVITFKGLACDSLVKV